MGGQGKKIFRVAGVLGLLGLLGLAVWRSLRVEVESRARAVPKYAEVNIVPILERPGLLVLSVPEYKLLYEQTGMSPAGVDAMIAKGRQEELLELQEKLFAEVSVVCTPNTLITREERGSEEALIPCVENGDLLVTFNCHTDVWRNGHVAIVVDAEKRLAVEARQLGTESGVFSLDHWETYPAFAVLRLKDTDREERAAIGKYAGRELLDIPYRLEAGVMARLGVREEAETLAGTHCAHLAWYAYEHFGYNIDNDGGLIVTPKDIFDSKLLQVVQIYGMPMPDFEEIY